MHCILRQSLYICFCQVRGWVVHCSNFQRQQCVNSPSLFAQYSHIHQSYIVYMFASFLAVYNKLNSVWHRNFIWISSEYRAKVATFSIPHFRWKIWSILLVERIIYLSILLLWPGVKRWNWIKMSLQRNPFLLKCKSLLSRRGLECSINSSLTLLKKGNVFTKPSCLAAHWRINCSKAFCFLKASSFKLHCWKRKRVFLLSETGYSNNHPSCSTGNTPWKTT